MLVGNKRRAMLSRYGFASGVLDGAPLFRAGYLRRDARRRAPTLHVLCYAKRYCLTCYYCIHCKLYSHTHGSSKSNENK